MTKTEIRKSIREKRESLSENQVKVKSKKIIKLFLKSDYYKNAKAIMSYMPIKNEVDVTELNQKILSDGKKLILPVIDNSIDEIQAVEIFDLTELRKKGKYSIMEPDLEQAYTGEIDLIIVPGVAFDKSGNRVGFGKGYYDQFLCNRISRKLVLAYDFQIVNEIKTESFDEKIDIIIDENKLEKIN